MGSDAPRGIDVDPELRDALARSAAIQAQLGAAPQDIAGLRAHMKAAAACWNEGGPSDDITVTRTAVPGPLRDIPIVIYRPKTDEPLPAFIYLHGGGYRFGDEDSNSRQLREIASIWGGAVVSADYAHLPERTFPHAVIEIASLIRHMASCPIGWNLDGSNIAFGGSSAGANVALGAMVEVGGVSSGILKAGAIISPVIDRDFDSPSMVSYGRLPYFPSRNMAIETWAAYAPERDSSGDPRADISLADLAIFPPLFIATPEVDVFRSGAELLAKRLQEAGRSVQLVMYPGMTHLFFGYSRMVSEARRCIGDVAAFLARHVPPRRNSDNSSRTSKETLT